MKHRFTLLLPFLSGLLFSIQNLEAQCLATALGGTLTCSTTSVALSGSANVPNATYAWSGPSGFSSNLQNPVTTEPGNYILTVTDPADGCTSTAIATVYVDVTPPSATASASNGGILDCINPVCGLSVIAFTPGATFFCSGPNGFTSTQQNPTVSFPGVYTFVVTAPNGCSTSLSVTITQDIDLPTWTSTVSPAGCNGQGGSISCTWQGNYTFLWSNNSTSANIQNLSPGTYCLTVIGATGCTATECYTVEAGSGSLNFPIINVTPVKCFGGSDGSISVSASGGTPPYTFTWSGPSNFISNVQNPTGLKSGNYMLTITDDIGCSLTTGAILVAQPMAISIPTSSIVVKSESCPGAADGSISLSVAGGTPPYQYIWNNGMTGQAIDNLPNGNYTLTVVDANGCTMTSPAIQLAGNSGPVNWSAATIPCPTSPNNGSITLTANFGTPPFSINYTGPSSGSTSIGALGGTANLQNLPPGNYQFSVSDSDPSNVCQGNFNVTVVTVPPLQVELELEGNGCDIGIVRANVTNGSGNYSYQWPLSLNLIPFMMIDQSGIYSVTVTDLATGCSASDTEFFEVLNGNCGRIEGKVFNDLDFNCLNANDLGLGGWVVAAFGQDTFYAVTDSQGIYSMGVFPGNYEVTVELPGATWALCQPSFSVNVALPTDTVWQEIPAQPIIDCPEMEVEIAAGNLRRCFTGNYIHVNYCNKGAAAATDAFILVELDPLLTALNANHPYNLLTNNTLRFDLGTVESGECGNFSINTKVSCDAILGQTLCYSASVFPDTPCVQNALWSGAHLDLAANCASDSLLFILKNTGTGDMHSILEYVVIEDGVMLKTGFEPGLPLGWEMKVKVPANGSTWRIEAKQEIHHPGNSMPSLTVEGCTTNASFSTGYVNQFPLDEADAARAEECSQVVGSFDPNDKTGFPLGFGNQHYIRPGTDLEYLIRFQNTGTDTAFTVVIRDTISQFLNPASIREPIASHPFSLEIYGEGILKFTFDNILLPDSNVNEAASHGFVKFRISQRPDVPLETDIFNSAAIYFDFNEPVITNTTVHRVGENFLPVKTWQAAKTDFEISAMPNPFTDATLLNIKGLRPGEEVFVKVFDLRGNLVRAENGVAPTVSLKRENLPEGAYFLKIEAAGGLFGLGKIVVR